MTPRRSIQGFTLVELLVVIVIIAILTTLALVSLNVFGSDPRADKTARQIADLAQLAAQQAEMTGQEYGLRVEPHAYGFYVYDGRRWTEAKDNDLFRRRELDPDIDLILTLEGTPVKLVPAPSTADAAAASTSSAPTSAADDSAQQTIPQVLLLSSGELPPFEIEVKSPTASFTVKGNLSSGICVLDAGMIDCEKPQPHA